MITTVGEARNLLRTKAKFGDEECIMARDWLRIAEQLDGLEISCSVCLGSGTVELDDDIADDPYEDDYMEGPDCSRCRATGIELIRVEDFSTFDELQEWLDCARLDGVWDEGDD